MRRIPIFLYHRVVGPGGRPDAFSVTASRFENHMSRLSKSGWRTVSLPDWFEHHQKHKALPDRSFVLTFDDGHLDNRTEAFPILRRFGFSATIFLAVNAVESGKHESGSPMLDWEAVREMQSAGFGFESHGMSHRRLTEISSDDARGDIVRSKQILEDRLSRPVSFFAYPFMDFNPAVQTMVREAGYLGACGGLPTWEGSLSDPYAIGRTEVLQSDGPFRFSVKTATGYGWRLYIKKRLGRWRRRAIPTKSNRGNPD